MRKPPCFQAILGLFLFPDSGGGHNLCPSHLITPEEDEEQLIMRRMRNSVDELRRGYRLLIILISPLTMLVDRWLDYRMQRVKTKAADSKDIREGIELFEEKAS